MLAYGPVRSASHQRILEEDYYIIKKFFNFLFRKKQSELQAKIVPARRHNIVPQKISPNALQVLQRLNQNGFSAYLVGGSVRDILLNKTPKDFDIATEATPEKVKKLFRNCLLIGRRFRLAHLRFRTEVIEVTTFRAGDTVRSPHRVVAQGGMVLRDNSYGSLTEDVWRRDFTINALYYSGQDATITDYCGGLRDLKQKSIRLIGDPMSRYREDPVRLLRAIRFAAKLGFQLEAATETALIKSRFLLKEISNARLFEETLKLFHGGKAVDGCQLLVHYQLVALLFPHLSRCSDQDSRQMHWLLAACHQTDRRILDDKTVSPAFLFAVFLWHPFQEEIRKNRQTELLQNKEDVSNQNEENAVQESKGPPPSQLRHQAASAVLAVQHQRTLLPRFCTQIIKDIWLLQFELEKRSPSRITYLLHHPRFRAAYDFLLLRAECHEISEEIAVWWTTFLESDTETRAQLIEDRVRKEPAIKKKRTRKPRKKVAQFIQAAEN